MLTFEVDDMDTMVPRLIQLGGILDGAIKYLPYGKVASLRSPHGHMIGLYQRSGLPEDAETSLAAAAAAQNHLQRHNEGKGGLPTDNPSDK